MSTSQKSDLCFSQKQETTTTRETEVTAIRHAKTGRINLGSLKAACRKLWKAMDLDGLEALKNEIDISDSYHRDFVEGYLEMVQQGRSYINGPTLEQ